MNKKLKKALIVVLAVIVGIAAVWGILLLVRNANRGAVNVYSASNLITSDYWGDTGRSTGNVREEDIQKIYASETQTITEILVSEGQEVKQGDMILKYDSSLKELDVSKAKIELEKKKLALEEAYRELDRLKSAGNLESLNAMIAAAQSELETLRESEPELKYPELPLGEFTEEEPYYFKDEGETDIAGLFEKAGKDKIYVVPVTVDGNYYTGYHGLIFSRDEEGKISFSLFEAQELEGEGVEPSERMLSLEAEIERLSQLAASAYSSAELARLKAEQETLIRNTGIEIKSAELEYKKVQKELDTDTVYAETDGVIKVIRDPETAYMEGSAIVEISGGGGYYFTGTVSELDLTGISIGQQVDITFWNSGTMCTGTITEISDQPSDSMSYYGGNSNVSWYPVTVFIEEGEYIMDGEYGEMTYSAGGGDESIYLQNMFIRYDNGKPYIYARGEDMKLEKRYIRTGKSLWESYTQIKEGLTEEDWIAFPYGNDVTEGARTQEAETDQLYAGLY